MPDPGSKQTVAHLAQAGRNGLFGRFQGLRGEQNHLEASSVWTSMNLGIHVTPFYCENVATRNGRFRPKRLRGLVTPIEFHASLCGIETRPGITFFSSLALWKAGLQSFNLLEILLPLPSRFAIQQDLGIFVNITETRKKFSCGRPFIYVIYIKESEICAAHVMRIDIDRGVGHWRLIPEDSLVNDRNKLLHARNKSC